MAPARPSSDALPSAAASAAGGSPAADSAPGDPDAPASSAGRPDAAEAGAPLWTRLEPERRRRSPITREQVVDAAVALADAEGLDAVSIRRVAAALETRPMGLYSHIGRKDDLLDLMLDRIVGDGIVGALPSDWRAALRELARRTRAVALRHPWVVSALGRRRTYGPNALRHAEQSLAAVEGLGLESSRAQEVAVAVDTYVIGHLVTELGAREVARGSAATAAGWRRAVRDYLVRALTPDELPRLAALGPDGLLAGADADADEAFERGLDWLLAGIEASLGGEAGG